MIKTFSIEDGTLKIHGNEVRLYSSMDNQGGRVLLASNLEKSIEGSDAYLLQSILYPTDEQLAESKYPDPIDKDTSRNGNDWEYMRMARRIFIAGRKSVPGEFHLTREEFITALIEAHSFGKLYEEVIEKILKDCGTPTFPHTITVEHDGDNYLWETLKAES